MGQHRQVIIRLNSYQHPQVEYHSCNKEYQKIPSMIEVSGLDDITEHELGSIIFQLSSHRMVMISERERLQRDLSIEGGQDAEH